MVDFFNEIVKIYKELELDEQAVIGTVSSMILSGVLILIKLAIGLITGSLAFLYSCVYSVAIVVCKVLYLRHSFDEKDGQKKIYYFIIAMMIITAAAFNFLMLIRVSTSYVPHRFSPVTTIIFGAFVAYNHYLISKGIKAAKEEQNLLVIELRTVNLSSVLLNMVLLQQMVLGCLNISVATIKTINMAFGISCGMAMFFIAISMLIYGKIKWAQITNQD